MKTWHKVVLGVVAVFALALGIVFYATSGITDTADRFFAAARAGDYATVRSLTAEELQRRSDEEAITAYVRDTGLDQIVETSWSSRSTTGDTGELSGTGETANGSKVPLTVYFVNENDEWKITSLDVNLALLRPERYSNSAVPTLKLPAADAQENLVRDTTDKFVAALGDPDFTEFMEVWHPEAPIDEVESNFGNLRRLEPQMRLLKGAEPEFTPATPINKNRVFRLKGQYVISNGIYSFKYDYIPMDDGEYALVAMDAGFVPR